MKSRKFRRSHGTPVRPERHPAAQFESLENRRLLTDASFGVNINFQPAGAVTPAGYLADTGTIFADHGNGYSYGWRSSVAGSGEADTASSGNQAVDTFIDANGPGGWPARWELAVPQAGAYAVLLVADDPTDPDDRPQFDIEGLRTVDSNAPAINGQNTDGLNSGWAVVNVMDGALTVQRTIPSVKDSAINFISVSYLGSTTAAPVSQRINFTPANVITPGGYLSDTGLTYRSQSGVTYGWAVDNTAQTRDRAAYALHRQHYTLTHLQRSGASQKWEVDADGDYYVRTFSDDPSYNDGRHLLRAEGVLAGADASTADWSGKVSVHDGRFTLTADAAASNAKINFLHLDPTIPLVRGEFTQSSGREGQRTTLRLSRPSDSDLSKPITVRYILGSTVAVGEGASYRDVVQNIAQGEIPAGATSVEVLVALRDDGIAEDGELLGVTVLPGEGYLPDDRPSENSFLLIEDAQVTNPPPAAETIRINFQTPGTSDTPTGYLADVGAVYGDRGNGQTYGWDALNTEPTRDRNSSRSPDNRYDTFTHLQRNGDRTWQIALPNGDYTVSIGAGDPSYQDHTLAFSVEGKTATMTKDGQWFDDFEAKVTVADGKLTIRSAAGSWNNKISFIDITPAGTTPPPTDPPPTDPPPTDPPPVPSLDEPVRVNFQKPSTPDTPAGYVADIGRVFGDRDNGLSYGWNFDTSGNARDHNSSTSPDNRYDTFTHLQRGGDAVWEIAVPNGTYQIHLAGGDGKYKDNTIGFEVERTAAWRAFDGEWFDDFLATAIVTDGRLTIRSSGAASNNKLSFIEIVPTTSAVPLVGVGHFSANEMQIVEGHRSEFWLYPTWQPNQTGTFEFRYHASGSARLGSDYELVPYSDLPIGARGMHVGVHTFSDTRIEETESAGFTLKQDPSFFIGQQSQVTWTILDVAPPAQPSPATRVSWSNMANPPQAFTEMTVAEVGSSIYFFGGFDNNWSPRNNAYRYDATTGQWHTLPSLPNRLTHVGVAVDGDKIYLAGGYVGLDTGGQQFGTTQTWIFDTKTQTYTAGPSFPKPLSAGAMVRLGRELHYFGGHSGNRSTDFNDHWVFGLDGQTNGQWVAGPALPVAVTHAAIEVVDGKAYLIGGDKGVDENAVAQNVIQIYDPAAKSWQVLNNVLPAARSHWNHASVVHNGRIVLFGGYISHGVPASNVWSFDPITKQVSMLNDLSGSRAAHGVGLVGDTVYVVGGYRNGIVTQAQRGVLS